MRWTAPLLALSIAGAGCSFSPAISCSQDSDCPAGGFCKTPPGVCEELPDAGPDGGACTVSCPPWQSCAAGACLAIYANVSLTEPVNGSVVGSQVTVSASLALVPGATPNDPSQLTLVATPSAGPAETVALPAAGGEFYQGTWSPALEADYQLVVSYPDAGLFSPPVAVIVDKTPPSFGFAFPLATRDAGNEVDPDPAFAGAWRRDESLQVVVSSSEPHMTTNTVFLLVYGIAPGDAGVAVVSTVNPSVGCGQAYCGTATVDLSQPVMDAFHGVFGLAALGSDLAGNQGTTLSDAGIPVTRWKWSVGLGGNVLAPLASSLAGNVYVPLVTGGSSGGAVAVSSSGKVLWTLDAGAIATAPAVSSSDGGDRVYLAAMNGGGLSIYAVDGTTAARSPRCTVAGATGVSSAFALGASTPGGTGATLETAFLDVRTGSTGSLLGARPDSLAQPCTPTFSPVPPTGTNPVTDGARIYVADGLGNVQAAALSPLDSWSSIWAMSLDGGSDGLALFSQLLDASSAGNFAALSPSDGSLAGVFPDGGLSNPTVPALFAGGGLVFGSGSQVWSLPIEATIPTATASVPAPLAGAPVIGKDQSVYVVDQTGTVSAFDSLLTPLWSFALPNGETSGAPPLLDCSRNSAGQALTSPGVLYVAGQNGDLFALIADSHGIDTTSPWPMTQHDPRNTGSSATDLTPFRCP